MPVPVVDEVWLARDVRRTLDLTSEPSLTFLARGEYSLNFLLLETPQPLVVRVITGSQIGLSLADQVRYEARALQVLEASGRTPRLWAMQPEASEPGMPYLVESYLPGRPLDYATDLEAAARCMATIHQLPVPDDHGLQMHEHPGPSILRESREWAAAYLEWPEASSQSRMALQHAFEIVERDSQEAEAIFDRPDLVIVNYDLNTHNFIVDPSDQSVSLVDWEKARIAPAVQDLAHFLLPTTTLWRTDTACLLTPQQETMFLDTYLAIRSHLDQWLFTAQLAQMRRLIALRAVSWCSWAVVTAAQGGRAISNEETLERSRTYLEPAFLDEMFDTRNSANA